MLRAKEAFTTGARLLIPTSTKVKGAPEKSYPPYANGIKINCEFKSYGGSELESNGTLAVIDTAKVTTWYDPRITSECQLALSETRIYDILGEPEDINERHQFMTFKVKRVKGNV